MKESSTTVAMATQQVGAEAQQRGTHFQTNLKLFKTFWF